MFAYTVFTTLILPVLLIPVLVEQDTPVVIKLFKEEECLSTWYQVAGSEPCENCCVNRTLSLIKPMVLNATDVIKRPGSISKNEIRTVRVRKDPLSLTYRSNVSNKVQTWIVAYGNCRGPVAIKGPNPTNLGVLNRDARPVELPLFSKFNIKLYDYNAREACVHP